MAKTVLNSDRKREIALDLYLNTDKSQKEICAIVGWNEKTFTENKNKYNWDALKGASTLTAQRIIMKLYTKMDAMTEEEKLNPDGLYKVAKMIEMMSNKRVNVSHFINCFKEFTSWFFSQKPEMAKEVLKYMQEFITEKVNNG